MDRRFFVLTTTGERGPFTVDDLKRELKEGLVHRSDQLRTALGKSAGTVGEMIGPGAPARSSGRMSVPISAAPARQSSATNLRPISEIRRASSSSRNDLRKSHGTAEGQTHRLLPVFMIIGVLAVIAAGWWLLHAAVS